MKKWQRNSLAIIGIILFDQITKYLAKTGTILFDTKFLAFNFVKNTGSSFGMLQGFSNYLIWVSLIVLGGLIYYYPSVKEKERIPLLLIASGIVGNLIDRVLLGYVIDFIDFKFWPVFNVADSAICIGAILLIVSELNLIGKKK